MNTIVNQSSIEEKTTISLLIACIPPNTLGYTYLKDSIFLVINNFESINFITKELYPIIAKKHNTTISKIERNIRHAIKVSFEKGGMERINSFTPYPIFNPNEKPTNSEFIALMTNIVKFNLLK